MDTPTLAPRLKRELAYSNPLGVSIDPEVVQAWAEIIWPAFRRRGYKYKERALAHWWTRVSAQDIERATQRLQTMRDEAENRRLEALARDTDTRPQPPSSPQRRFRVVAGGRHG